MEHPPDGSSPERRSALAEVDADREHLSDALARCEHDALVTEIRALPGWK